MAVSLCYGYAAAFCFYALWDKVPLEVYNSVFTLMEELLDLPLETKKQETIDKPYNSYYGESTFLPLYESLGIDDPLIIEGVKKFIKIMCLQDMIVSVKL
ncbi:hypothetical protein L6164_008759 [Bauhinia variegata]|uniref:Uncharacterized protein n=1 Tax=Bauhinia variegata TaxID=167791 RepID=A0ACB9PJ60_BAUVA|nr:hypothetical protein L6164_008759 [Bauhinia variegata]